MPSQFPLRSVLHLLLVGNQNSIGLFYLFCFLTIFGLNATTYKVLLPICQNALKVKMLNINLHLFAWKVWKITTFVYQGKRGICMCIIKFGTYEKRSNQDFAMFVILFYLSHCRARSMQKHVSKDVIHVWPELDNQTREEEEEACQQGCSATHRVCVCLQPKNLLSFTASRLLFFCLSLSISPPSLFSPISHSSVFAHPQVYILRSSQSLVSFHPFVCLLMFLE